MTIFDWVFAGLLSLTIVAGALALWMLFLLFRGRQQYKAISFRRPKEKKKRKRWAIARRQIEKKKKKHFRSFAVFAAAAVLSAGAAFYGRHYQAANLGEADGVNIGNGYTLVNQVQNELGNLNADQEMAEENLYALVKKLGSYGNKRASGTLTEDGQLMLNRYYSQLSQLAQNLNIKIRQIAEDETIQAEFSADISKITDQQKRILTYYSISEDALISSGSQVETVQE